MGNFHVVIHWHSGEITAIKNRSFQRSLDYLADLNYTASIESFHSIRLIPAIPGTAICGHREYGENWHCAGVSCWNYTNKVKANTNV